MAGLHFRNAFMEEFLGVVEQCLNERIRVFLLSMIKPIRCSIPIDPSLINRFQKNIPDNNPGGI